MSEQILITGANGGFGTLIVDALLDAGHRVAASMRAVTGRNAAVAERLRQRGAQLIEIDVTHDASVEAGVRAAAEALGGLTVLINNAGVGVSGLQEAFTADDFKRLFDVNVVGVQRMNRAVLPLFREQHNGLLVHVSSLLGRITVPFYGPYNATKWAVEALAETYRVELSPFGVETVVVEPGGYPTTFIDNLMRPSDHSRDNGYGEMASAPQATLEQFHQMLLQNPAQDPRNVAEAVARLVALPKGQRPFRTVVDNIGMGAGVEPYNQHAEQLTRAIYGSMQMTHLLDVQP